MTNHTNFQNWFKGVLEKLCQDENAGFVLLIVAFPLLERYLRQKSGTYEAPSLSSDFYTELRKVLPLPDEEIRVESLALSWGEKRDAEPAP